MGDGAWLGATYPHPRTSESCVPRPGCLNQALADQDLILKSGGRTEQNKAHWTSQVYLFFLEGHHRFKT